MKPIKFLTIALLLCMTFIFPSNNIEDGQKSENNISLSVENHQKEVVDLFSENQVEFYQSNHVVSDFKVDNISVDIVKFFDINTDYNHHFKSLNSDNSISHNINRFIDFDLKSSRYKNKAILFS